MPNTGDAILRAMAARGDYALRDSTFETNQDGSAYEMAIGRHATWIAGNASGEWEVAIHALHDHGPSAPVASAPPRLLRVLDVSSWQPYHLDAIIRRHAIDHVIVRLYIPGVEAPDPEHGRAQLASARDNGCTVSGYIWVYRDAAPDNIARALGAKGRALEDGLPLALDVESYNGIVPTVGDVAAAAAECERLGAQPAIYTRAALWRRDMGDSHELAHLPLWTAEYNERPDLDVDLFGGWDRAGVWGHQWTSDPYDLSVFDSRGVAP